MRKHFQVGLAALAVVLAGCGRNEPKAELRWRFVGGDVLQTQTNAPALREILQLPEAAAVAGPLATNLAAGWWQLGGGLGELPAAAAGDGAALMRDLLTRLSIGEVVRGPGGGREFAVAVNGLGDRAAAWEKAWPNWIKSLRGDRGGHGGEPAVVRRDTWLLAVSDAQLLPPDRTLTRLAAYPAVPTAVLQCDASFSDFPQGQFVFAASNGAVRVTGKLTTARVLPKALPAWEIPSVIHEPLVLFIAARGLEDFLGSTPALKPWVASPAIGQVFIWGQQGVTLKTLHTYGAALTQDPEAVIGKLYDFFNPMFAPATTTPRFRGELARTTKPDRLAMVGGIPAAPTFEAIDDQGRRYVTFGVIPANRATNALDPAMLAQLNQPGVFYYGWEITAEATGYMHVLGQLVDLLEGRHAIVTTPATKWALAAATKLGETVTLASVVGDHEVRLQRKSPAGLSGLELALLARWLDPVPPMRRIVLTNSSPATIALPQAK